MGILGDLLLSKTRAAEERSNNIDYLQAQGLISAMGKQNPDGSPVLDAEHLSAAQDQLNKLVGTTKEGKGLVQQFSGLVQKLHGHAHQQAGTQGNPQGAGAGAPPPGDAGGGGAAAQGGQAGPSSPAGSSTPLLPPPPTPATPASSAATAPDAAAAMSTPMMPPPPPPGASVGAGNASPAPSPAGAPASPPSPPSFAQIMSRAGTPRSPVPGTPEATAAELAHGRAMADASGFKPGSREHAEILTHQNLPSVMPQRKGSQILGSDLQQSYPGIKTLTGEDIAPDQRYDLLFDSDGNTVASPSGFSAAATKPGSILYTDANGQQQEGRMVGGQPIDAQGNPLPAGTKWTPYERGLVSTTRGTTSTDPFGNVTRTTSTIAPNVGGVPTPPGISKSKGGGASSAPASSSSPSSSSSSSSSSKMPPLDADGHIPAGTANSQVVEAANQLLDGTDKDKLPIKVRELASSLARQYGWEQDKFTPKEQNMMRLASTFIDQAVKDPSLSALDDGWLARQQLSRVLADPSKENMLGAGATSLAAMNLSPQQEAFRRMYNQLVGTISGLSQLSRATRPTESSIQRLMTELPNPLTTKDSADGRATLRRLQEEIKLAMQKKSFTGQDAGGGGRATPNLPPLPSARRAPPMTSTTSCTAEEEEGPVPPGNDTAAPSTTAAATAPDISTTLQSNDFLNLPLDQKHKFLLRAVPEYAGLPPKEQAGFLQRFEPTLTQDDTDTGSVAGSFLSRAWQTAKGTASMALPQPTGNMAEDLIPPPLRAGYQMLKGQLAAEKKAGGQLVDQTKSVWNAPDASTAAAQGGRALVTGAAMLDPLATSSVADINERKDAGRTRDAIGTGAFDALMLLAGKGSGAPTEDTQLAKLTSAVGTNAGTDTVGNLRTLLPDIEGAVTKSGIKPTKIGQLMQTVDDVKKGFNDTFGNAMNPIRNKKVMPSSVSNALLSKITPNMAYTAEGQAEADALRNAAVEFQKPWTIDALNEERMRRGSKLDSFYGKDAGAQNSAMRSRIDTVIDKTIRDEAANTVYDEVDAANPGMNVKAMKQRHSAAIQLSDQLHDRVEALENQQFASKGKELGEKLRPHAYVGGSGIPRAHLSGLTEMLPGGGAMDYANTKVAKAFGPTAGATARRAAVLSLPLTRLAGAATPMLEPPPPPPDIAQ